MIGAHAMTAATEPRCRPNRGRRWFIQVSAWVVGSLLIRSACIHIENSYSFLSSVYSYRLLSPLIGELLAALLPYFHLTIGLILLLFPAMWKLAFSASGVLFAVYSLAKAVTLARGLNIACGCFSSSEDNPINASTLIFSICCTCIAIVAAKLCPASSQPRTTLAECGRQPVQN